MNSKIDSNLFCKICSNQSQKEKCLIYLYGKMSDELKKHLRQKKYNYFKLINAICLDLNIQEAKEIAKYRCVIYVSSCCNVCACCDKARRFFDIDQIHKYGITGKGVTIAYIDTGISPHLDFMCGKNRLLEFKDFINGNNNAYDDNGHGTQVAGAGSGNGVLSCGKYKGFAPESNIIALKALGANGEADSSKILAAMDWIYQNRAIYNIKIACMSFGSEPIYNFDPIIKGAEALWAMGVIVVCAAGNSGPDFSTIKSPGASRKLITVGGLDERTDKKMFVPQFSSRGPIFNIIKPDIIAPAVDIMSCSRNSFYEEISGTSISTPIIAGICACFVQKYPNATPMQVKSKLLYSCSKITNNPNIGGYGYPNLYRFLN